MTLFPRRPSIVSTVHGNLIALAFPNAGTISATTDLGIVWANPADHTELLSPLKGFNFDSGFGYNALNVTSISTQTGLPGIAIELFIVDSTGADLYTCGSAPAYVNSAVSLFGVLSFHATAHSTPGSGIRGQVYITGTGSVVIPSPLVFFGA